MAITGAIFNSLIFGGINSADYGVYISGNAVFNAPQRAVELVSVPGRNGSIAIDQGHFENIEVEYPAGLFGVDEEDFRQRLSDFRNAIMSQKGYQRLSDTYHPDEYRMGMYIEGLEVDPVNFNEAGKFTLKFNCKPQRYLTSGEEEIDVTDWRDVKTLSGESVTFNDGDSSKGFQSIKTVFNPSQDGTPWKSEVQQIPYLNQPCPDLDHDYNSETFNVLGGSVAWNQLVQNGNFADTSGWGFINYTTDFSVSSNTITATGRGVPQTSFAPTNANNYIAGHKYLFTIRTKSDNSSPRIRLDFPNYLQWHDINAAFNTISVIFAVQATTSTRFEIIGTCADGEQGAVKYKNCMLIDLTSLFANDPTIADYLYSLEQATAGSGAAKLKEWGFDLDTYHQYQSGSLESVNTSAHETVGKNLINPSGFINNKYLNVSGTTSNNSNHWMIQERVFPNVNYAISPIGASNFVCWYDANMTFISAAPIGANGAITSPSEAKFVRHSYSKSEYAFGSNCQLEFGSTATEYEPYVKHSYPLDSDVTLRGLFKLDANNNLYAEGDVYLPSGEVARKWTELVFDGSSDEPWERYSSGSAGAFAMSIYLPSVLPADKKIICDKLTPISVSVTWGNFDNWISWAQGVGPMICTGVKSITTVADWRTYLASNPIHVVVPLTTETTETADPFTPIQDVSPYGTEEYIDYGVSQGTRDIAVPVGHQTKYIQKVPIEGKTQMKTYVSPTSSVEDATEYTTSLNGTKYGGTLEVVSGTLEKTFDGITYTGQTINEPWLSDCDEYQQGATPTYGATVVYELTTPTEISLTAQAVAMLDGTNVVWADADSVEVKYGVEPGKIYNPTLFDAQPLLEVSGYGNINVGDYEIVLDNASLGEVQISEGAGGWEVYTLTILINTAALRTGDLIYNKNKSCTADRYLTFNKPINTITNVQSTLCTGTVRIQWDTLTESAVSVNFAVDLADAEFQYGIEKTATATVSFTINWSEGGSTSKSVSLSMHYDGTDAIQIGFATPGDAPIFDYLAIGELFGDSSIPIIGDPTYVDCELGEAYKYESGEIISLNSAIDLGSNMPVLSPGVTSITYDNTITDLKILPRWWKI